MPRHLFLRWPCYRNHLAPRLGRCEIMQISVVFMNLARFLSHHNEREFLVVMASTRIAPMLEEGSSTLDVKAYLRYLAR